MLLIQLEVNRSHSKIGGEIVLNSVIILDLVVVVALIAHIVRVFRVSRRLVTLAWSITMSIASTH